jgi:mono/diheme cytochrome c family protein
MPNLDTLIRRLVSSMMNATLRARCSRPRRRWMAVLAGFVAMTSFAQSQEFNIGLETGKAEYLANCAKCHGVDGKGAGPHSVALKKQPADLTVLAKHNHGVFPVSKVYQLVDGRGPERKHLSDEMPIWGCRQNSPHRLTTARRRTHPAGIPRAPSSGADLDAFLNLTCDPEATIQRRIMSIVAYLSHIQTK